MAVIERRGRRHPSNFRWNVAMAVIERRGKRILLMGKGGIREEKFATEREARSMESRINFLRENNKKEGDHLKESPIVVNTK